jgi:hypothetical protein
MAARRFYNTVPQDETDNRPPTRVRGSHVSTMKVLVKGYPDKLPLYYVLAYVRGEDYVVATGFTTRGKAVEWMKENFK